MPSDPTYDVSTYRILKAIHEYLCDGRIYLARERLEELLKKTEDKS